MGIVRMARLAHWCSNHFGWLGGGAIAQCVKNMNRVIFACDIAYQVDIDKTCIFPHQGLGTVIHPNVKIGKYCTIFQNVTLGEKWNGTDNGTPVIRDHVLIGCGSVLLGAIHIGNNAVIAANAVVLCDVPENCMAVGAPARIINRREVK